MRRILAGVAAVSAAVGSALLIAGCSSGSGAGAGASGAGGSGDWPVTVRLGYLANITHAPAL
ncbi:MAG: sulfonate ABC transporter substrate-binding protein, partial [Nocardiopsaceae bacterium]|nr:sulfonate ABC transporter substrate-binding protein [Nocardiopsaceae bacterium]